MGVEGIVCGKGVRFSELGDESGVEEAKDKEEGRVQVVDLARAASKTFLFVVLRAEKISVLIANTKNTTVLGPHCSCRPFCQPPLISQGTTCSRILSRSFGRRLARRSRTVHRKTYI